MSVLLQTCATGENEECHLLQLCHVCMSQMRQEVPPAGAFLAVCCRSVLDLQRRVRRRAEVLLLRELKPGQVFTFLQPVLVEDLCRTEPVGMKHLHNGGKRVCCGVPPPPGRRGPCVASTSWCERLEGSDMGVGGWCALHLPFAGLDHTSVGKPSLQTWRERGNLNAAAGSCLSIRSLLPLSRSGDEVIGFGRSADPQAGLVATTGPFCS